MEVWNLQCSHLLRHEGHRQSTPNSSNKFVTSKTSFDVVDSSRFGPKRPVGTPPSKTSTTNNSGNSRARTTGMDSFSSSRLSPSIAAIGSFVAFPSRPAAPTKQFNCNSNSASVDGTSWPNRFDNRLALHTASPQGCKLPSV